MSVKKIRWSRLLGILAPLVLASAAAAGNLRSSDAKLEKLAGRILVVGFYGTSAPADSAICRAIRRYDLGGVILFDRDPIHAGRAKNISSPAQLKKLTKELQECSPKHRLLIAVDEEGGAVQRLKKKNGFSGDYPRASAVAAKGPRFAKHIYKKMASELSRAGVNFNLAPVVDLALNPKNRVIVRWGRSYGKDPQAVARYAGIFIEAMHRRGILTSLKHFPGHGSSTGDTHKGFVDVSKEWKPIELEPYRRLIHSGRVDTIMVAHIFNRRLDAKYPASLSPRVIGSLLRKRLGYRGVVMTDDLQMGAITQKYTLRETIRLAIAAGDDLLLFGNQLDPKRIYSPKKLVAEIVGLLREGKVSIQRLEESGRRIERMKKHRFIGKK